MKLNCQYSSPPEVDSKIVIGDEVRMGVCIRWFSIPSLQSFECDPKDLVEEKELGRGAYGAVYRMKHEPTGTIMAVKVSPPRRFVVKEGGCVCCVEDQGNCGEG